MNIKDHHRAFCHRIARKVQYCVACMQHGITMRDGDLALLSRMETPVRTLVGHF